MALVHHLLDLSRSRLGIHHLADVGTFTKVEGDKILFLGILKELFKYLLILWLGFNVEHLSALLDMVG
jgi:hypothetical protein